MSKILNIENLPIFEPLNDSTRNQLKKLDYISSNSYLEIWNHEDEESFLMRGGIFTVVNDVYDCNTPLQPRWKYKKLPTKPQREYENSKGQKLYRDDYRRNSDFYSMFANLEEAKNLGATDYSRNGEWQVSNTDINVLIVYHCVGPDHIVFRSKSAYDKFRFTLIRFLMQTKRAEMQAEYKLNKVLPDMPQGYVNHPDFPLEDYQKAAFLFGFKHESTGFFMQQGTGKTALNIQLVCEEAKLTKAGLLNGPKPHVMKVLIVCPNQVRINWQLEFEKFTTVQGRVTIIKGTKEKRIKQLVAGLANNKAEPADNQSDFYRALVIGYDTLSRDVSLINMVKEWDLLIIDESHYIKNHKTDRFKVALKPLRDSFARRRALTGTPISNGVNDLYSQLEFLGEKLSGFTSFKAFKSFFNKYEETKITVNHKNIVWKGNKNIPLMQERLARLTFSITKEEAGLNLPDKVYNVWEVDMTKRQTEVYNKMATQLAVEIEASMSMSTNKAMTANNVLTRLLRLAQITSGFVTWDEDELTGTPRKVEQIEGDENNPKIQAVLQILEEDLQNDPKSKTIIWACFTEDIRLIEKILTEKGIKCGSYFGGTKESQRQELVNSFNRDDDFRVLICNPKAAGEGLNLLGYDPRLPKEQQSDCYCGRVIFFSQSWSMVERNQAEDRAHRRGTKMPVQITDLMVAGTIDQEIRKRVYGKTELANNIQDIENILTQVLNTKAEINL